MGSNGLAFGVIWQLGRSHVSHLSLACHPRAIGGLGQGFLPSDIVGVPELKPCAHADECDTSCAGDAGMAQQRVVDDDATFFVSLDRPRVGEQNGRERVIFFAERIKLFEFGDERLMLHLRQGLNALHLLRWAQHQRYADRAFGVGLDGHGTGAQRYAERGGDGNPALRIKVLHVGSVEQSHRSPATSRHGSSRQRRAETERRTKRSDQVVRQTTWSRPAMDWVGISWKSMGLHGITWDSVSLQGD